MKEPNYKLRLFTIYKKSPENRVGKYRKSSTVLWEGGSYLFQIEDYFSLEVRRTDWRTRGRIVQAIKEIRYW